MTPSPLTLDQVTGLSCRSPEESLARLSPAELLALDSLFEDWADLGQLEGAG